MTDIKVFSTQWFKKYNKWIVALAKLPIIGEWIFCFKKYGHYFDKKNLLEVQPNAVVEDCKLMWTKCVKVNGQWIAYDCTNKLHNRLIKKECKEKLLPTRRNHYFVRNEYALRLQKVFYPIWITFHIWDIITRPIPQLNLGFDTLTVYPDATRGSTTVDGTLLRSGVNETFSTIRAGDGNIAHTDFGQLRCISLTGSSTSNQFSSMYRSIFTLDTSSLTSSATISSATFSLFGYSKNDGNGGDDLHICASTPAANNNLQNSDYGQLGTTSFGSKAYADLSITGYNDITLNASGLAAISKTGITKLGTRGGWDINNSFTGTWADSANSLFSIYFSDYGSNKPKLVVTYTTVVGPANVKTYKGLAAASVKTCKGLAIASVKTKKGLN